jgi:ABC-type Fe3+/spermidine/putrescine transport system ATPase subunit
MPVIELKNLTMRFGNITAVDNIDLNVKSGEYVAILGPSGCGKTTIVRMIAGILEPTSGDVYIDGKLMNNVPMHERNMGYVFQNIALFPHLNVWDNATYSGRVKGWDIEKTSKIGNEALGLVNLLNQKMLYPRELSGGSQQKTSLARALCSDTKLLLLDEPLSALDVVERIELRRELRRLVKTLNLTAIHVTHDQEEAMSISDRVVVMRAGKIVEVNTPQNLYNYPKKIFTANFVGESNFIEGIICMVDGPNVIVEMSDGNIFRLKSYGFTYGDAIVVSIRPENITIEAGEDKRENTMVAVIDDFIFIGSYIRYILKTKSGGYLNVDVPIAGNKRFNKDENVIAVFDLEKIHIYKKPEEGLPEVLKLE